MKLSTKGRYGLRALIDLALYSETEAVPLSSIAARQGISESYLEQLFGRLRKAGLITSIRGAQGGYQLARPAAEISAGDILRALEGNLDAVECSGLQEEPDCEEADLCVMKIVWQKINESITKAVDKIMMDQLVAESRAVQEMTGKDAIKCEN